MSRSAPGPLRLPSKPWKHLLPPVRQLTITTLRVTRSKGPSKGAAKPQGLAKAGHHHSGTNTIIEDFDYKGVESGGESDEEEEEEDSMAYPGNAADSLVSLFTPCTPLGSTLTSSQP